MTPAQIADRFNASADLKRSVARTLSTKIHQAAKVIAEAVAQGRRIFFFGNGGSAADAQHLASEFVGRFVKDRRALPAMALSVDSSALTAIGNDYGFEQVFARQLEALGGPQDVAIGISTSGRSPNVIAAIRTARVMGLTTIALLGGNGGELANEVDIPLVVPSSVVARIQECHITIGHVICEFVDESLFGHRDSSSAITNHEKIVGWKELLAMRELWRSQRLQVVWTNGCFDLLHRGHIHSLRAARSEGDLLIVGVNSDVSVRQLKGPERPIVSAAERAEMLAALECVDFVIIFDESSPAVPLSQLQPDVHCKGAEYGPPNGKPIPEAHVVTEYGGRIAFLPMTPQISTTDLVDRIRRSHPCGVDH